MSRNTNYISKMCAKIVQEGGQPSVALIRARSDRTLPIPEVISVLKRWKQDPAQFEETEGSPEEPTQSKVQTLEQRVCKLEEQMSMLLQKLDNLRLDK